MIINHNMPALNTYNKMEGNSTIGQGSLAKLSSGLRINKAGDDAAGLVISEKMRSQVRGLDQASRNAQDGVSLIQTAEGGLNEVHSILQRMRELADQSANGTNTADDRSAIQTEVTQLKSEVDRIGNTTEFNTQKLLNGNLKTSGVVAGDNVTTSAVVAKLTAGKMTAANTMTGATTAGMTFEKDTFTIDGHDVEVNWDTLLTTAEKASLKSATAATGQTIIDLQNVLTNTMNKAIDNYNSSNAAGATVGHITSYLNSNKMTMESSTQGVKSQVSFKSSGSATSVGNVLISSTPVATTTSVPGVVGTSTYNGTAVAVGKTISFKINGVSAKSTITAATAIAAGANMTAAATSLQTALQTSIDAINATAGKTSTDTGFIKDVKVTAGDDGRFVITDESGTVTFEEQPGETTIKDLGLTQAQTDSSGNGGMTFQIGANKGQTLNFGIADMRTTAIGIAGVDVSTAAGASNALTSLDSAIKTVSSERAKLGAVQNRLEHTVSNLSTSSENLTAAESRIRDVDMAKEMMNFSKSNILTQAAQAMMAQANQAPQGVLQLLR